MSHCPWCGSVSVAGRRNYDCGTPNDGDATERDRDYACFMIQEKNQWREAAKALYALIPNAKHDNPSRVAKAMELYEVAVKGDSL